MFSAVKKFIPDHQQKQIKKFEKIAQTVNELEPSYQSYTDEQLQQVTHQLKERLQNGETLEAVTPEAFAAVREAAFRVLGMRPYDVQLFGGLAISQGDIAEMGTGEGKTLVAALPSYLRALEGKGVHVITVNDYLAKRDFETIGQVHQFLGLTVGINHSQLTPEDKVKAYDADITYGVGSEFGFDYLRDNMATTISDRVQRPFHFAIIDEIDSILIDEAKTPLVIAGKTTVHPNLYYVCARMARSFKEDKDYSYDRIARSVNLTDSGITKVERAFGIDNLYDLEHHVLYHFVLQALRAKVMFHKDVDYIVDEDVIKLVDMFTGRIMEGRSLGEGLHQAIEAKEDLEITQENKTQATITVQNYFRMYPSLSGMTGTAKTEEEEMQQLYGMDVIQIPSNKERIRIDNDDVIFRSSAEKYNAVAIKVKDLHQKEQPVIVGTSSIIQSETVASYLDEAEVPYELLNAKSVENEVQLISLAGQKGQVTIATNMAGRGTDIMLGEGVAELGGLYILGTERHESRRIDNQLKGRSGRQGDPGITQFYISLEDDMVQRFAREDIDELLPKLHINENGIISDEEAKILIDRSQDMSEQGNFSIREYNLKLDNVIYDQRKVVYEWRDKVMTDENPLSIWIESLKSASKRLVEEHTPEEEVPENWDLVQLKETFQVMVPVMSEYEFSAVEETEDIQQVVNNALVDYLAVLEPLQEKSGVQAQARKVMLSVIDSYWLKQLEDMAKLKEGINLRSYGQEDPLRTYNKEGYELFTRMYNQVERDASMYLARILRPLTSVTKGVKNHA
ncbi:accessory Sec system translocase SecA2 [Geomicrobium sp. JCM 19038]|uniref:accessory Sec system translocase SecA2 n=1 Tax=Geomicrobium sp. JCM 19038 TaxID=1460635 RepID=UPI00045F17D0|nr:accessory Sec system translocase SecA2 [Geomicrobium sp. JCM 19038]GAK07200.1 export cytoplasm protein SecA ATPase RNA helicase [Geomicrobium sp. JCM 19038]